MSFFNDEFFFLFKSFFLSKCYHSKSFVSKTFHLLEKRIEMALVIQVRFQSERGSNAVWLSDAVRMESWGEKWRHAERGTESVKKSRKSSFLLLIYQLINWAKIGFHCKNTLALFTMYSFSIHLYCVGMKF